MATGYPLQSPFAQALQNRQDQGLCSCPYPDHGRRIFQDIQQFLDYAKIKHHSDFGGLDTRQSRVKLRELSIRFRRSDHLSVAKAGDQSVPDIGGLTSELEKEPRRTSLTSGRKRSAPTDHEFTGRKGQAPCHVEVADPGYPMYTPSPYPTTPEPSSGWSTDVTKSRKLASSQPQSSDRQPQRTIPKPQPSQRQLGILHLPHTDPRDPKLILQPDSRPISQEWLASLVNSIYAGLMMVETKCMEVDRAQAAAIAEEGEARTNLASDHWQTLIALHRTLLHEHHAFFIVSQHPSSSPELRRLADHMLAFIYLAYQMVTLFYETVPAFEDTWIVCLGDLGRFRMAIEDDVRDRKTWAGVARSWYVKAADKNPTVGRLYHHLAILARPHVLLQMYYYSRSFAPVEPFQTARESIKILLDSIVEKAQHTPLDNLLNEEVFVLAHATQFNCRMKETGQKEKEGCCIE
ncbi:hypothetical protein EJ07DRAFT_109094 [Lizonia empirigonia]|nr:hypothetical protein EJ07DRAFT_109094 [Lizonia empirigonia]